MSILERETPDFGGSVTQPVRRSNRLRDRLDDLLDQLLTTGSWFESKATVEAHPDLLSTAAEDRLSARLKDLPVDGGEFLYLIVHQQLLGRCREVGLDAGFADLLVELPVQATFDLLTRLNAPGDPPRRILLLYRLLLNVPLDRLPPLWSMVVDDLGKSLFGTRIGLQEANVERAISELQRALNVRTRHEMPLEFLDTLCNLATAFRLRVRGNRAENLDQAIELLEQALKQREAAGSPTLYARICRLLAESLSERPSGNRENNLDRAITLCQNGLARISRETDLIEWADLTTDIAQFRMENHKGGKAASFDEIVSTLESVLSALDPDISPYEWARAASFLGVAYSNRRGSAKDLEDAIDLLERTLTLQERVGTEYQVAETANNLAAAYLERVNGKRSENLERAIQLFERALASSSPFLPQRWLLFNLAIAYSERVTGDRSESIERAIALCEGALDSPADQDDRSERAKISSKLSDLYMRRLRGDRPENLERCLWMAEKALELAKEKSSSALRLKAHVALGGAYTQRARGDRDSNLEQAARTIAEGLRDASPEMADWPNAMISLANIYTHWPGPDRSDKIEIAKSLCDEVLDVLSRDTDPFSWAQAMQAKANACDWRMQGNRAENLEEAINAYRAVLEVRTLEAAPIDYLETLNHLAGSLRDRRLGDPQTNLLESMSLYRKGLKYSPQEVMPSFHSIFQGNLGRLLFYRGDWRESAIALQAALEASERLYRESATPEGRLAELRNSIELPSRLAYSLAKLGEPAQALEALERNRGRLIAEALDLAETEIRKASEADRLAFEVARQAISALETEVRALGPGSSQVFVEISGRLRARRRDLATVVERIRSDVPDFLPAGLDLPAIATLTRRTGQPLVFLVSSPHGSLALLLSPGESTPEPIWLDGLSSFDLRELLTGGDEDPGFISRVSSGESEHMKAALGRLLPPIETGLIAPLIEALTRRGVQKITLVPCGTLGLLPLPALLAEHLAVSLIPSARAWRSALDAAAIRPDQEPQLLAVSNPENNLPFASLEVDAIEPLFSTGRSRHFTGRQARRADILAAAPGATCLHFVCHGTYQPAQPLDSELTLAASESLKIRDLLDGTLDLAASRLVVLSACETGIFDIRTAPDEVLGFPVSFLQAGAPAVLSTLWKVSDEASSLLLSRFYHLHLSDGLSAAEALRQASLWLRKATAAELGLADHYRKAKRQSSDLLSAIYLRQRQATRLPDAVPFADPYYWAAFVLHGAGGS